MNKFLTREIFKKLKTDHGKIKIEQFFQDGIFPKINYTHDFRLRMDIILKRTESYKEKTDFIKSFNSSSSLGSNLLIESNISSI